jgi:membrane protease YdiL (CAAX protease family)
MKQSGKSKKIEMILMSIMALISLTSFLNIKNGDLSIAGISTIFGAVLFFVWINRNKKQGNSVGLSGKNLIGDIKISWLYIIMPSIINIICIIISKLFLPDYVDHVVGRTDNVISFQIIILMVIQFVIFAFLEEISWRGFLQKQLGHYTNPAVSIIITSVFFSIGHVSKGNPVIVIYDVFFVFCNSIFYGLVFQKTKNSFASAISHFIANLSGALILLYIK